MNARFLPALLLGLVIAAAQSFAAAPKLDGCKCPVSGAPVKEANALPYKGKQLFFCCGNCPKKFEADPETFAAAANEQLVCTGQAKQIACPISGGPAKAETAIEVAGVSVAFCCKNCQGKVSAATGDEQRNLVFANLEKGFTTQSICPVSGKPINPKVAVDHNGKKVYFCCEGCPGAFEKDPAKFESQLK